MNLQLHLLKRFALVAQLAVGPGAPASSFRLLSIGLALGAVLYESAFGRRPPDHLCSAPDAADCEACNGGRKSFRAREFVGPLPAHLEKAGDFDSADKFHWAATPIASKQYLRYGVALKHHPTSGPGGATNTPGPGHDGGDPS